MIEENSHRAFKEIIGKKHGLNGEVGKGELFIGDIIMVYIIPMIILFIIYYKVFRIADDVKEIKRMLENSGKSEANKKEPE